MPTFLVIMLSVLAVSTAVLIVAFVMVPLFKGLGWLVRHIFAFLGGMAYSVLRIFGALLTVIAFIPLILLNIVIGRWSAASHYGRGVQDEFRAMGQNAYRLVIGHPARLLLLSPLLEGIEKRVPEAVAHAPTSDKPSKRQGQFDGYKIVGSLKGGGSGGRLYIAEPDDAKKAALARRGVSVGQVVIKTFSLADGSSLPQIVRESKSLEAAKNMGLILEHELTDQRFFYVMRYVPGDTLSVVTNQMHDRAGPGGLEGETLREAVGYVADLARTLEAYHQGGLWHKDVKPDNIIVSAGRAHLVDFGLVTPLRSAMTLTTHGTEYFRDPEMVRLALKGVKVADVNGAKFDVYAVGAVLYSLIERNFPAHGGLSQITKKCPEALRWIVRRAMAEYDSRYASAGEMLRDLDFVMGLSDPAAARPVDLPSMQAGAAGASFQPVEAEPFVVPPRAARVEEAAYHRASPAAASPVPPQNPAEGAAHAAATVLEHAGEALRDAGFPNVADRMRAKAASIRNHPRIRMTDWWRGGFSVDGVSFSPTPPPPARPVNTEEADRLRAQRAAGGFATPARHQGGPRRSAREQLDSARARVRARQERASSRFRHGAPPRAYSNKPNAGVGIAVAALCVVVAGAFVAGRNVRDNSKNIVISDWSSEDIRDALRGGIEDLKSDLAEGADGAHEGVSSAKDGVREAAVALRDGVRAAMGKRAGRDSKSRGHEDPSIEGRWVVVDDLADSLDEQLRAAVAGSVARLQDAGAEVVGIGDHEEDLAALAEARAAIGASRRVDDGEAQGRIKAWLAEHEGEFDGVVWFAPTDKQGGFSSVVIGAEGTDAEPVGRVIARVKAARDAK